MAEHNVSRSVSIKMIEDRRKLSRFRFDQRRLRKFPSWPWEIHNLGTSVSRRIFGLKCPKRKLGIRSSTVYQLRLPRRVYRRAPTPNADFLRNKVSNVADDFVFSGHCEGLRYRSPEFNFTPDRCLFPSWPPSPLGRCGAFVWPAARPVFSERTIRHCRTAEPT